MKTKKQKPESTADKEQTQQSGGKAAAKKKKSKVPTIVLVFVFLAGLGLILYPTVSNWWNSFHQSRAIAAYSEAVAKMDHKDYEEVLQKAHKYNENILERSNQYFLSDAERNDYYSCLDVAGSGIIGYIQIDKIGVQLPIYHGTADTVLQVAVGHLDWTSLPVGGVNTHAVLSGHRGLPSAKLFTNLDKLEIGDTFIIRVLDEIYTYEVDQILIVLPQDTEALKIVEGEDCVTLVTCTPYGVNSHRMLVRGKRTENAKEALNIRITNDATRIEPLIVATCITIPILIGLFVFVMINDRKRSKNAKMALAAKLSFNPTDDEPASDEKEEEKEKKSKKKKRKNE